MMVDRLFSSSRLMFNIMSLISRVAWWSTVSKNKWYLLIFTTSYARGLPMSNGLSVCPSVRLSVCQTHALWQNETNLCRYSYTTWKGNSSSFPTRRMIGGHPLVPEILGQTDPAASKTAISNRYSLVAPQPLDIAKKVQLSLIGIDYALFNEPKMNSVRCHKPPPPKEAQKRKLTIFCLKLYFSRRKSAEKCLCVKNFRSKVVRVSLAYLAVHKWFVEDIPST